VATGEDQSQVVVLHVVLLGLFQVNQQMSSMLALSSSGFPAQSIHSLVARGRD
jgi:hypothetical protein